MSVVRQQHARTLPQNRYYWLLVQEIADFIGESRDATHDLMKDQFLPKRDVELIEGQRLTMPPTTRTLTVEQFTAYIEQIKVWSAQFLGLPLPEAGQVEVSL